MMVDLLILVVFATFLTLISFLKQRLLFLFAGPMWIFASLQLVKFSRGFFFISLAFGLILVYYGVEDTIQ